jgi:hypothetical protein
MTTHSKSEFKRLKLMGVGSAKHARCECADPGCPVHKGTDCGIVARLVTVRRSDMDDVTGTRMCPACAEDALESGVFYTR